MSLTWIWCVSELCEAWDKLLGWFVLPIYKTLASALCILTRQVPYMPNECEKWVWQSQGRYAHWVSRLSLSKSQPWVWQRVRKGGLLSEYVLTWWIIMYFVLVLDSLIVEQGTSKRSSLGEWLILLSEFHSFRKI